MNRRPCKQHSQAQNRGEIRFRHGRGKIITGRRVEALQDFADRTPKEKQRSQDPEHWGAMYSRFTQVTIRAPMLHRSTTRVLLLLCVMYMITYMDRVNVSTGAIGFGKEFHLSNMQIGLVFSAFAYPYLCVQVTDMRVGDRICLRRTRLH